MTFLDFINLILFIVPVCIFASLIKCCKFLWNWSMYTKKNTDLYKQKNSEVIF